VIKGERLGVGWGMGLTWRLRGFACVLRRWTGLGVWGIRGWGVSAIVGRFRGVWRGAAGWGCACVVRAVCARGVCVRAYVYARARV